MNDKLPDKTIIVIMLATLLLVFMIIFSFKSNKLDQDRTIQWKDSSIQKEALITT